jgi:hypothetical protein
MSIHVEEASARSISFAVTTADQLGVIPDRQGSPQVLVLDYGDSDGILVIHGEPYEFMLLAATLYRVAQKVLVEDTLGSDLTEAEAIVKRIQKLRAVQSELKAGFARDALEGGAKAALDHPLYLKAAAEIVSQQDRLKLLI